MIKRPNYKLGGGPQVYGSAVSGICTASAKPQRVRAVAPFVVTELRGELRNAVYGQSLTFTVAVVDSADASANIGQVEITAGNQKASKTSGLTNTIIDEVGMRFKVTIDQVGTEPLYGAFLSWSVIGYQQ